MWRTAQLPVEAPASAGIGGGSGTAELGAAAEVFGAEEVALGDAEDVALGDAEEVPDEVAVPEVVALDDVLDLADPDVVVDDEDPDEDAGACGLWKSVHDSVRKVSPPTETLSASVVTV